MPINWSRRALHVQVLIVGGGPSGSYAASVLAREGIDVVVLESAKFPRYHIGESLLPSVRHFLRFVDAEEKVMSYGFVRKPGAVVKFNQNLKEGYTDFVALGASNASWNVVRAEFDHLLLKHARESGAKVFEETRVKEVRFEDDASVTIGRPRSVTYETGEGVKGEITFDYLVDASGRAGLMSTKYLKNRKFNSSLKNVAQWGYWKNTGLYGKDTARENAPVFEALIDESGWAWFIPLHKGVTSVGVVMDQTQLSIRNRAMASSSLTDRYRSFLLLAPTVRGLIGDGELVTVQSEEDDSPEEGPTVRSASDYSYSAPEYASPNFRIIGDAGAFIDPFSSGVHLAMTGGLSAAASIAASIRGDCTEQEAANWHTSRISLSYTRFLLVVLSAYKQIRGQSANALADVEENNFDKAFAFLRPVIQGGADMGARLSEDEVQRAIEFCSKLFEHTTPEQHDQVRERLEAANGPSESTTAQVASPFDTHAPVVAPSRLDKLLRPVQTATAAATGDARQQAEIRNVLGKVNARRIVHAEYGNGLNTLEAEDFDGYVLRLKKGQLGLQRLQTEIP
ncbi:hypothetical protein C8Q76DRAFT_652958 [Earliella scabrosa]|nr:hypothetical protein C8Q76DRAFT_652958 [Earliella scabrosa]